MYTHCPHCRTTFRIYTDQLAQARGQVRCGVCNYCFNALETLSEQPSPPSAPAAPGGEALENLEHVEPLEQSAPAVPIAAEESLEEAAELEADAAQGLPSSETVEEALPGGEALEVTEEPAVATPTEEETAASGDEALEYPEHVESLEPLAPVAPIASEESLEESAELEVGAAQGFPSSETVAEPTPSDEALEQVEQEPAVAPPIEEETAAPGAEALEYPEYAESLEQPAPVAPIASEESLEESAELEVGAAQGFPSPETVEEPTLGDEALEQAEQEPAIADEGEPLPPPAVAVEEEAGRTAESAAEEEREEEAATHLAGQPHKTLPDLGIIAAEPRPMAAAEKAPSRIKTALWAVINVVLILTLAGQYAYYNRDELAQYPELQPWLAQLCTVMACDTPLRREVSRIALTKRVVESHPSRPNALLIDATLVNQADFPQPYPLLEIRFSDLNNQLVAGRRFRPSEYLPPGTPLEKGMPPHQPVHIVLEIVDPGKDAVSFLFNLL